jgi:hypothetical protein
MADRSRAWCFTLNNYTEEDVITFHNLECEYIIVGKEMGESQTPHLQGYVYFANARSFASMKKLNGKTHFEKAKGSPMDNYKYCSKEGNFYEKGTMPSQGKRAVHNDVRKAVADGVGMREIAKMDGVNYQTLRSAELLMRYVEKKRDFKTQVVWLYGEPGSGKTRYAYDNEKFDDIHLQNASNLKFFQEYDAHPVVILDEVDSDTSYVSLKALCDRHPYSVDFKGGSRQFLARRIYITSLRSPQELFQFRPYNGLEMLRRIDKVIYCHSMNYTECSMD